MRTCGATPGGPSLDGIDLTTQAVIQGVILRDGEGAKNDSVGVPNGAPIQNAHVRLLDTSGEFTAEVPTNPDGQFRFFAAPGPWTLVVLAPGVRKEISVQAALGTPVDILVAIPSAEPLAVLLVRTWVLMRSIKGL
mgnify:CR=1 FL=1